VAHADVGTSKFGDSPPIDRLSVPFYELLHTYSEFGVFPVTDVIDVRKSEFIVKYDFSDNLLCELWKKKLRRNWLIYCVSTRSFVKFTSMYY